MNIEEHDACGVGFIADLAHAPSHDTIAFALEAAGSMRHRGARAADGRTGDGAGILCETPRAFLARELAARGLRAAAGHLAAICVYLPQDHESAVAVRAAVESAVRSADVVPLAWRSAEIDEGALGEHARRTQPLYEQLIVDTGPGNVRERMRVARRMIERALRTVDAQAVLLSASATAVVYKGLLSSDELAAYFRDLKDPLFAARFAVFHQRFSTNTSPSWRLVQPFEHVAHNGEINTISGNRGWLRARGIETHFAASDSLDFETAVDAMLGSGYRVDDAIDLLLAPAVGERDDRLRAYYDAHLPTVEPWDGPAAMVFTDGDVVGAALDRSGFRPLRWCRTASGKVLVASEAGVVDFGDDPIIARGRLGPGERIVVRFASGELVEPPSFVRERRERADFRPVVASWRFEAPSDTGVLGSADVHDLLRFAYSRDEAKDVVGVLASGSEPVSSMGDDAAPAFFDGGQPLACYLRQRFAQVTNPPIDPFREALVFDMRAFVGSGGINGDVPAPRSIVMLESGVLDETSFDALRFDVRLVQHHIPLQLGEATLETRLLAICDEAQQAIREGASLIVLDDRAPGAVVPGVLAAGAVHQRLIASGLRMQASIVVADGFARDAHSIAAVIGMGANVVTPWLALRLAHEAGTPETFLGSVRAGLLKVLAKLGICTLRSYVGAQTFEALGLARSVCALCFPAVKTHAPAVDFARLERDLRFWEARSREPAAKLSDRGTFRYRREGVRRSFDPNVIKTLRASAMQGDYAAFERLSDAMETRPPVSLHDLIEPIAFRDPVALEAVEGVPSIVGRFATAAMSLGALGPEAHAALAAAANAIGARSNSGEGGEDPKRYARGPGSTRSRIKQVASARFGVSVSYLASADEIEIKMAQGSKPGEGGQIPGHKVTAEIAALRGATPGQALISPPPHHDIYSIEDLAQLIYDLRRAAPHARIAVKLVSQSGIGYVASGVAKAQADVIHISGHDGGTGASPLASIKHAGLPWELGLVETHHTLLANGLRSRVRLRVDGGFKSGRDVVLASMLGADEFGFGSAALVALGCIYARQCHKNTCPVGIATQDPELRKKFAGKPEEAIAYLEFVAHDVRRRLAALGATTLLEIQGRSDHVRPRRFDDGSYEGVDLSEILRLPEHGARETVPPKEEAHLDDSVTLPWEGRVGEFGSAQPIGPQDRAVGARIAHAYAQRQAQGFAASPIALRYAGTAGQSFGAFLTGGITLDLAGDANDYVGKSMDGGRIIVRGQGNPREPVVGNACFYGARGGEAFVVGTAGERFGVRNSGARLVVEGAGAHACEYMTGGAVAILGPTGRNLASGMTGGTLFVLDEAAPADLLGPTECVVTECRTDDPASRTLRALLEGHVAATGSQAAQAILTAWPASLARVRKIAPVTVTVPQAASAEPRPPVFSP